MSRTTSDTHDRPRIFGKVRTKDSGLNQMQKVSFLQANHFSHIRHEKKRHFLLFSNTVSEFFMTKYSRLALFFRVVFLRFDEELEHEKLLHNSQDPKSNNLPLEESTKLGKAKLYPTSAPASSGTSAVASSQVCYNSSILPMIDGVNQQSKKLQMILCMPLSSLLYTVSLFSLVACGLLFCKAILSSINQVAG